MTTRPKWLRRRRQAEMQAFEGMRRAPRRWITPMATSGHQIRNELAKLAPPKRIGW